MNIAERQKPPPGELYLDHVSHFVPDLEAAARVLERLGFAVTPVSIQQTREGPVGASNRCVMLEEGYLELLTPTHDTPTAARPMPRPSTRASPPTASRRSRWCTLKEKWTTAAPCSSRSFAPRPKRCRKAGSSTCSR